MTQEIKYLQLLAGLVRCQPCGMEMTVTHDPDNQYVCPTLMENGPDDCTTHPIDTAYLEVWPESHWPGFALCESDVFKTYMAWWCM